MRASEIRERFLSYFERQQHARRPSSSLIPTDDPTLLFTNAGMVQFKRIFLGLETPEFGRRATTAQKCVRAGGKHNDLEQVGHTARHHTFFEMLGNFSFGDYFKREAIAFAWEFVTKELALDARHLRVTVYEEDDEARALWREVAGLPDSRIYGLGDRDNFWQMADTGPCGPCSELYVDMAHLARDWQFPPGAQGEWTETGGGRTEFSRDAFVEGAEAGRFLEIWNLVFMQYDRQPDGTLIPLPRPSVDTGAGLERIAAVMQGVTSNYHTDLFAPLIAAAERALQGIPYRGRESDAPYAHAFAHGSAGVLSSAARDGRVMVQPAAFRVLADHARAVAFLLADGVYPSNEGRGYVLRRILRRAVRHAWLLGRAEPTLVTVVDAVVDTMGDAYPELRARRQFLLETTRAEEERFLQTIGEGMRRFDELAPVHTTQGSTALHGTIAGEDAFRLYDTYGFPLDLTELMARERGYTVDVSGFERALGMQREQSREERRARDLAVGADALSQGTWDLPRAAGEPEPTRFVGYDTVEIETQTTGLLRLGGDRVAVMLRETPFYVESGGQVSDRGEIVGDGWRVDVDDVRKVDGRIAAVGTLHGTFAFGRAVARVPATERRDTERNHTATHLLHAALRQTLGEHVHQAGSLVAPDRLRFDFTHHGPLTAEQLAEVELFVNRGIWADVDLSIEERAYADAVASGAMALFGEKYGDVVRVVSIPGWSVELCGGTHARNTGQIALFKIVSETGVAAGVRRIEAVTGPRAYALVRDEESRLRRVADALRTPEDAVLQRVEALLDERRALQRRLDEALRGGDQIQTLLSSAVPVRIQTPVAGGRDDGTVRVVAAEVSASDVRELQAVGDALRDRLGSGVAVVGARFAEGKTTLLVVVTDDLRAHGVRADAIVKELAAAAGGRGGGKAHMAQAGIPDASRLADAIARAPELVRAALARAA
ncbi:MAG TPA: alanine--tRNA ligase [Gemmatimonadaceae bacterium]|nr:alanine--tRNA ligase [Gemmatimonadaceae bacterium]